MPTVLGASARTRQFRALQATPDQYGLGMPDISSVAATTPVLERPILVAVDGVDGSGKTTFAECLATAYTDRGRAVRVVHMDDFLNPRSVRYRMGRTSPEGFFADTYDLAAFTIKVLNPLQPGATSAITLRAFDHLADKPVDDDPVEVPPQAVVVIEGMFLHRDELCTWWDMSIFLDVPFGVTVPRMAQRDGAPPDPEHPSWFRYLEGQRIYLSTCKPTERATYVIDNY